ncbi:hypothetical protein Scep_024782 [Stephania cephalantha]|uniref:Uncharacterized protein n=1 Tax=Stephania cephalantha TaxID=152367 RepID=A0AAP0HXF2_9MAGN
MAHSENASFGYRTLHQETKPNPKELNPYFKDNGNGYPKREGRSRLVTTNFFLLQLSGDGGASWRLKALKRAQNKRLEKAENLRRSLKIGWGSRLVTWSVSRSLSLHRLHVRAHLHAIKDRKRGLKESSEATWSDVEHESATRNVDDNVWVEITEISRNASLAMFGKAREARSVFLETVIGLAKQRRSSFG